MEEACYLRCKIDPKYECRNPLRGVTNRRTNITACHTCEIFIKAKQAIFTDNGGGILLSLEKELKKKVKEAPEFMSITDLPDEIKLLIVNHTFKTDARGNEALFLYLRTRDDKIIVQKYTSTAYQAIFDAIKEAGGSEHLKVHLQTWQKQMLGRMQKPRLAPIKEPSSGS